MVNEHSPTPWVEEGEVTASIFDVNGKMVASYVTLTDKALIVTAVNAYEANTARLSELEERVARLQKALAPFAAVYRSLPEGYRDDLWVGLSIAGSSALDHEYLTVRDFRSALEAQS